MEKKISFKVPLKKYIEFKGRAATKYKWENGYTSNAVNEAIDLWLLFESLPGDMKERHLNMMKIFKNDSKDNNNPIFTTRLSMI